MNTESNFKCKGCKQFPVGVVIEGYCAECIRSIIIGRESRPNTSMPKLMELMNDPLVDREVIGRMWENFMAPSDVNKAIDLRTAAEGSSILAENMISWLEDEIQRLDSSGKIPLTPKSDILKDVAEKAGIPMVEPKISEAKPEDFKGLPQIKEMEIFYSDLTKEAQDEFDEKFGPASSFNHETMPLATYVMEEEVPQSGGYGLEKDNDEKSRMLNEMAERVYQYHKEADKVLAQLTEMDETFADQVHKHVTHKHY